MWAAEIVALLLALRHRTDIVSARVSVGMVKNRLGATSLLPMLLSRLGFNRS